MLNFAAMKVGMHRGSLPITLAIAGRRFFYSCYRCDGSGENQPEARNCDVGSRIDLVGSPVLLDPWNKRGFGSGRNSSNRHIPCSLSTEHSSDERSWGVTFFVDGLRRFGFKEWTIMEGTLGLRVNFSDRSIEVA
jgi:hypothetical protein